MSSQPSRDDVLRFVAFVVDDTGEETTLDSPPGAASVADCWLVGWQAGFEPHFVAVRSILGHGHLNAQDAEEIATEALVRRQWFTDNEEPPAADYVL